MFLRVVCFCILYAEQNAPDCADCADDGKKYGYQHVAYFQNGFNDLFHIVDRNRQ